MLDTCRETVRRLLDRLASSEIGARLASGTFWSLLGGVASQALAFLASITIARVLGRDLFGEFGMVRSTALTGSMLAAFGIGLTATKHVAEYRRTAPERAGRVIALAMVAAVFSGGIMAGVLFAVAVPLAQHALGAPHLAGLIRLSGLLLFLNTVMVAQTGALAGLEAFRAIARIGVVSGLLSVPILITAALVGGLPGAVVGLIAGWLIRCVLNLHGLLHEARRSDVRLSVASCFCEWRTFSAFSFPGALSNMVKAPAAWVGHALLVNQAGGYAQMGLFNAASQWATVILFVPQRMAMIALPVLSSLAGEDGRLRFKRTLRICLFVTAGVAVLVAAPVILLAPWIVRLYGSEFASGAPALRYLAASAVLMSLGLLLERVVMSLGRVWLRFLAHLLWAVVLLVGARGLVAGGGGACELATVFLLAAVGHVVALLAFLLVALRGPSKPLAQRGRA